MKSQTKRKVHSARNATHIITHLAPPTKPFPQENTVNMRTSRSVKGSALTSRAIYREDPPNTMHNGKYSPCTYIRMHCFSESMGPKNFCYSFYFSERSGLMMNSTFFRSSALKSARKLRLIQLGLKSTKLFVLTTASPRESTVV
ncbi:hypothetical protein [Rubritalea tangerina]|uniref:hypothetical protein n=1 Tax=Rubritalea tangerina TaxID=430798 RepID=UPI003613F4C0